MGLLLAKSKGFRIYIEYFELMVDAEGLLLEYI